MVVGRRGQSLCLIHKIFCIYTNKQLLVDHTYYVYLKSGQIHKLYKVKQVLGRQECVKHDTKKSYYHFGDKLKTDKTKIKYNQGKRRETLP